MAYTKKNSSPKTPEIEAKNDGTEIVMRDKDVEISTDDSVSTSAPIPAPSSEKESILAKENANLKQALEDLQAQIAVLMKASASTTATVSNSSVPERNIPFINMTPGTFMLKGTRMWRLEGQFASRNILEREARAILNNMPNAIHDGYVYIADAEFVRDNELEESYKTILSDDALKNLFNNNSDYIIEVYKNTSDGQRKIILDMIIDKKENGLPVDANVLIELGKLSGKDLINIEPLE